MAGLEAVCFALRRHKEASYSAWVEGEKVIDFGIHNGDLSSYMNLSARAEERILLMETHLTDITRVIQLAVAPVFLLTAIATLINGLRRGPLWVAYEGGSFQHAVVYSGFYTDSSGDESATVFRIHDPWPPGQGTVYSTTYRSGVAFLRSVQPPRRAMIQYVAAPG